MGCVYKWEVKKQVNEAVGLLQDINVFILESRLTGLGRESAHPLQLHVVKRSCCTVANPGATVWLSP